MTVISLISLSAVVFASTNIDDLFVLVGFFSHPKFHHWQVITGQILGIGTLIAISLAAAYAALTVSPAIVGLIGLAPLAIGVYKLRHLWSPEQAESRPLGHRSHTSGGNVLTVTVVIIANGGDNLGVYAPLFASQTQPEISATIAIFAVLTLVWCLAAWFFVNHPTIGEPVRRCGHRLLPFILIGLGILILFRSGTTDLLSKLLG